MRALITMIAIVLATPTDAIAAETCGNGTDDDSDGYADEQCGFANATMGICESPLSCTATGDIGPSNGAWIFQLPPDFKPTVPYGPALTLRRTYISKYAPPSTNYRTALGPRWHHNWMSWLDKSGSTVVVHLPTGQDVKFTYANTISGFDYYTPQAGYHVKHLRQATSSPNQWELRTLTGETLKYDWSSPVGKLVEIWDTLPTPNKIVIAYVTSGGDTGQIDTVTDASGKKRFKFNYTSGLVSSVDYQTVSGGTPTTRASVSYSYTSTNLVTVTLGTTIQSNTYTSSYLTKIADGDTKTIVEVNYLASSAGSVANVTTGEGSLGYDYNSSHAQCTGSTALYFNLANTSACNVDSDCGTGLRCGGKTGTGSTGKCYRAARCLQITSPSEDLITNVTAFTPCTGACAPTAQYSWNTSTLDLKGKKLADNDWTSYQRNSDGMITLMAQGDSDDDPTNSGGVKSWLFYGASNFPGKLTETRTPSDVRSGSTCDGSTTTGCKRGLFGWNNTTGLLDSKTDEGWLINSSGTEASFSYTTSYTYNSTTGMPTAVDGPLSGTDDITQFTYWSSSDVLKDGYVNEVKRKKNATDFLITTHDGYDYFGNAGSTQEPDGTFTCKTWDGNRNVLTQVREAMNGQTSCATSHSSDLTTNFAYDTFLRLTTTTRPIGDCEHRAYDAYGRLSTTKLRDDCVAGNAGNTKSETYDTDGLHTKTEYLNASSTVTYRKQQTYFDGRQLAGVENPVAPSYARSFTYLVDGQLDQVTAENGLGITKWPRDAQNRATSERRYTDATNYQTWTLGYPLGGATAAKSPVQVTDPASKTDEIQYDDLGRRNRLNSVSAGTTTLYVHDAASRLVTMVEAVGGSPVTHTFTYDHLGRKLTEDYDDNIEDCTDGTGHVTELQYAYDALPSGVSCPSGASCANLAHVKSKLLCSPSYGDSTLDQETFPAYDAAGRLAQEYLRDDSGRTALQVYAWDKNSNLVEVTTPSSASMTYTRGGSDNSDANLITTLARTVSGTPTNLLTNITWTPFGPVKQYDQANTYGGNTVRATLAWNLAYRASQVKYATTGVDKTTVDYTEDEKGRYTAKDYSNVHSSIADSFLQYDFFDRLTCDATASGTCPTSGSTLRTNVRDTGGNTGYNSSNDRAAFYHRDPAYGDMNYAVSFVSGRDQISSVTGGGGTVQVSYGWDARGNRTYDDDSQSTIDRRDYTYDERRRVRTVTGKFRYTAATTHDYRVTYAYDHHDRLVFKSFRDQNNGSEGHYFFYYDLQDRLIQVKYTPNISYPYSYNLYHFYWLDQRPVAMWGTFAPYFTTVRYFMHADESNRVLEVHAWPSSGDSTIEWAANPDAFGWDRITSNAFQPLRLNNAIADDATVSLKSITLFPTVVTLDRPPLMISRSAHDDPMTATPLQRTKTWPDEVYTWPNYSVLREDGERTYIQHPPTGLRPRMTHEWPTTSSCALARVTSPCQNCGVNPADDGLIQAPVGDGGGGDGFWGCVRCASHCTGLGGKIGPKGGYCWVTCDRTFGIIGNRKCAHGSQTGNDSSVGMCFAYDFGFCGGGPSWPDPGIALF